MKTIYSNSSSVFDRLSQSTLSEKNDIIEDIRCHLSALFNTRRYPASVAESFDNNQPAITTYGLPEITMISADDERSCNALLTTIARQISIFEPRLRRVNVFLSKKSQTTSGCLELIIEAELHSAYTMKTLTFWSVIDLSAHHIQLEYRYAERISGALS